MTPREGTWDLVVVGAGPAGASTALAARWADPSLRVLLVDRASFPRDKACGDGVAPHVLDLLATVGVTDVLADRLPVPELRLSRGPQTVARTMARPAYVVPRTIFDARLVQAAVDAGAVLQHHRVRSVSGAAGVAVLDDGELTGRVVVGADGAHSVVARALGVARGPRAVALRGYAPVSDARRGAQVIAFGARRQPSYAWSFDRGDGLANVGYGEVMVSGSRLTRTVMLERLETLLPGTVGSSQDWRAHPLPLSTWRPLRPGRGRVLLVGDAAGLVNPLTGEGIFYAVATGLLAGAAAAAAVRTGEAPAAAYQRAVRHLLGGHLRHTALAARLSLSPRVLQAGLAAADDDQQVFDDLVELGLARGRLTAAVVTGLARQLSTGVRPARTGAAPRPPMPPTVVPGVHPGPRLDQEPV